MTVEEYVILLIKSVVSCEIPPEKSVDISFEDILNFAKKHKIENICFAAIRRLQSGPDAALMRNWERICLSNQAQTIIQENEKICLSNAFKQEKISYLPLKGWILRSMYLEEAHRFMSDIDILIHYSDIKRAKRLMKSLGYEYKYGDNGYEDSFVKGRYIHVELHHYMVPGGYHRWFSYYETIWDKAISNSEYEYRLNWNDFYIYMLVKIAKDYSTKGIGIRAVLDLYMFLKTHGKDLDRSYVDHELHHLGIIQLENRLAIIADQWFDQGIIDLEDISTQRLLSDGIYGSSKQSTERMIKRLLNHSYRKRDLIKLVFVRFFPGYQRMRYKYPALKYAPFLLPFFWVFRCYKHRNKIRKELHIILELYLKR